MTANLDGLRRSIVGRLESDQFRIGEASSDLDRAFRRGWNGAMGHIANVVLVELGLIELRDAEVVQPVDVRLRNEMLAFDLSDEGPP
jgi:hypothetical protein